MAMTTFRIKNKIKIKNELNILYCICTKCNINPQRSRNFQKTSMTRMNPSSNHAQQQKHLQTQTSGLNYQYNGQILMNQILVETLCIASIHITLLNFSHNKPQTTHFPPFSKNFEMQQKEGHRTTPGVQLNPKNSLPCYTEQHMFHATQSSTCSMLHRAAHVSNCQFDTINTNPVWVKLS